MRKLHHLADEKTIAKKLEEARALYKYQDSLTNELDNHRAPFDENTLLKIVLWKINRYPEIADGLLDKINELRRNYSEALAEEILVLLLDSKGFDLPMASTVLSFACPEHCQIIDQRVYRFIYPDQHQFKIPYNKTEKIKLYFSYLQHLKEVCRQYGIPFNQADRLLYQLDKMENKDIKIKY